MNHSIIYITIMSVRARHQNFAKDGEGDLNYKLNFFGVKNASNGAVLSKLVQLKRITHRDVEAEPLQQRKTANRVTQLLLAFIGE